MSCVHLTLEKRIVIALFVHMGMSGRTNRHASWPKPYKSLPGAAPAQLQIRLLCPDC